MLWINSGLVLVDPIKFSPTHFAQKKKKRVYCYNPTHTHTHTRTHTPKKKKVLITKL